MEVFHSIPGKLTCSWESSASAVVDVWQHYFVSLAEFKDAVMGKGVAHARAHRARAWVEDSSAAKGAFPSEIQDYIASEVFKVFAEIGIQYFVTINSASTVTNMTSQAGPAGLQLAEFANTDQALVWLREQERKLS